MNCKNLHILKDTPQLEALFTIIRDVKTKRNDFIFYSDGIIRLLIDEAFTLLPFKNKQVKTPTGSSYKGKELNCKLAAVSIIRAGESMEKAVREVCKKVRIGKILIQRDEKTAEPKLYYSKLPPDISKRYVLLLDPMLATAGSVCVAIKVLKQAGVKENHIIFVNLMSCPEGIKMLRKSYPQVKIVTGYIDKKLDAKKYIIPGIGDFGDRYFGTD